MYPELPGQALIFSLLPRYAFAKAVTLKSKEMCLVLKPTCRYLGQPKGFFPWVSNSHEIVAVAAVHLTR